MGLQSKDSEKIIRKGEDLIEIMEDKRRKRKCERSERLRSGRKEECYR